MTASQSNVIWTSKDAEKITGGKANSEWAGNAISMDTRSLNKGDIFIAIKGDSLDGHDYVRAALDKGAVAAIVSEMPDNVDENESVLIVDDTLRAMEMLGAGARARSGAKTIAVTGSVGKTSTKQMLGEVFSAMGQTHFSQGSYNNHWGVPFTLANMHEGTDFGIFEIGMNHAGEITPLTNLVKPDVAIITSVAPVHMEFFENLDEVARAKAEIFDGVVPGGTAILNRDNPYFDVLQNYANEKNINVKSYGEHEDADVRMTECLEAANGSRLKVDVCGQEIEFSMQIAGRHMAQNALSVLLAVSVLGQDLGKAVKALSKLKPFDRRGTRELLDIGDPDNPVTLIDESYNASPEAMKAAFKVMALIDPGRGGRRIAILGDMLELGKNGPKYHEDLALPLQAADVQLVYTCGTLMKNLHDALPANQRGAHTENSDGLAEIVPDVLVPGDVVMVKGSNGSKMGAVVEALRKMPTFKGKSSFAQNDKIA